MKKSLLNIAVTMALSSAIFSGSVLSTQAYADEFTPDNDNSNNSTSETYMYPGMGVGAATGTLIAGPAGFVIGGVIGAVVGSNHNIEAEPETVTQQDSLASANHLDIARDEFDNTASNKPGPVQDSTANGIQLAQLGPINPVLTDDNPQQEELMNILVSDLSLDVYFRSGSTDIEKFYPARLTAIADLVNTMDKLELHLDGYTDRRGNKEQNIALANERIEKVRQQLISAGVDESRIVSKAFGEAKMKSSAGNLEAYTFDRRVVIRFERASENMHNSMAAAFSITESALPAPSASDESVSEQPIESISPVVADATTRF